jgi:hypothetical protein
MSVMVIFALSVPVLGDTDGLSALYQARSGRGQRVSSADRKWRDGNEDWRVIEPGQTLTLADIEGPGVIRHIWFTINAYDRYYPRSLILRMYWEGGDEPAVESPIGDFFAAGHGLKRWVDSAPVAVTSEGRAYNCYWPMPFKKHARVTVTNDSGRLKVPKFYYYIDYDQSPDLPDDVMHFHAQYRQEYPVDEGDYLICDTTGRGHYVGTVLSVQSCSKGWFGEGDDRFYIDGDKGPGMHGTGTEDYFCDAWGFREFMRPYYGVVLMEGFEFGDRATVYRWHIADPIPFQKSLRFEIEHKGSTFYEDDKSANWHGERPDLYSSVAFWYQAGQAKRFASVPPLEERMVKATVIEFEKVIDNVKTEPPAVKIAAGRWEGFSGGGQLQISPASPDTVVTVPFVLDKPLAGAGRLALTTSISGGVWRVCLDGKVIPRLQHADLYDKYITPTDFNLGYVELSAGKHELRFECKGKRATSRDYLLSIDALRIEHDKPYRVKRRKN